MVEGSKQVRVDNWGIFFLQRLQIFFSKTDYCDLTLQFEGNVQLKVHRLVMNACTEYFTYLEQTCPALEEGTIMMPPDLQSDVIVPIVNFMYTGMLEFNMSIFDKLYKAAEIMNIAVLIKLLDAQKKPPQVKGYKRKFEEVIPSPLSVKTVPKVPSMSELPPTLPGRKVPVWKRRTAPHQSSQSDYQDKWSGDSIMVQDAKPKPTRFEWPDEDLPPLVLMDTAFEEISYTSKPLLTLEEEIRAISSTASTSNPSEETKQTSPIHSRRNVGKSITENSKCEKTRTRSESSGFEEVILFGGEEYSEIGQKLKNYSNGSKTPLKKSKNGDKENKETTISVKGNSSELDHTKIVSEILKKYPNLVKKNKNIKLKIMPVSTSTKKTIPERPIPGFNEIKKKIVKADSSSVVTKQKTQLKTKTQKEKPNLDGPWVCVKCDGSPVEFVLYYLYRKHMTDVHNEVFDIRLCKYCGQKCNKSNLMMYHLYTKHGLKPPATYVFPKCDQCPFIALSDNKLLLHKQKHQPNEMQCVDCKLAFSNQTTLTAHLQITGHFNRTSRSTFDCQYCTKKLQSSINLFSHIKNTHFKEAKKDGIVGLDELEEIDGYDEDEESDEEYIVQDPTNEMGIPKDKVKIISNVKVANRSDRGHHNEQDLVPLVQTTEADSLNNVTNNIATSLGLVDIVVLDENQQYILQENQEQTEFILPELSTADTHFGTQVITTQHSNVIPQGVLQASSTDMSSTDELVMVLTDHDYQEEQEGENPDNSNIVVLYSHPVDGQQGQFITSQGNLLVNSQTGMLELRNGTTITTTASNQIVVNSNNVDTPIESIEMIQREIESHQELKQQPFYQEQKQSTSDESQVKIDNETLALEEISRNDVIINDFTECVSDENDTSINDENKRQKRTPDVQKTAEQNPEMYLAEDDIQNTSDEHGKTQTDDISNQSVENEKEHMTTNIVIETTADSSTEKFKDVNINEASNMEESAVVNNMQDVIDGPQEEPMEIDEIHSTDVTENKLSEDMEVQAPSEEHCETKPQHNDTLPTESNTCEDAKVVNTLVEDVDSPREVVDVPPEPKQMEDQSKILENECVEQPSTPSTQKGVTESIEEINDEEMEVDGTTENKADKETSDDSPIEIQVETRESAKSPVLTMKKEQPKEIFEDDPEPQSSVTNKDEDNGNSPIVEKEDEHTQLSETNNKSQNISKSNPNINREILQDWEEDTDSQQSEKTNTPKNNNQSEEVESDNSKDEQRQAAVDKLMNDWDDEDEDDKRD